MPKRTDLPYVLSADVGGTSIRSGLVDLEGAVRRGSYRKRSVQSKGAKEIILNAFSEPLRENLEQAKAGRLQVAAIGIAMCGPLDYDRGICLMEGLDKYDSLYGMDLKAELRTRLSLSRKFPIHFEVDTWSFARGENWKGAGRGVFRMVAVTLGTGLGSAFLVDGEPVQKGSGVPPYFAWVGGLPCEEGILDDVLSRRGILSLYRTLGSDSPNDHPDWDVADIAHSAVAGNRLSRKVFEVFGERLGRGLVTNLTDFEAEALVMGGRISESFSLFAAPLKKALSNVPTLRRIVPARSIRYAALWGAARMAFARLGAG